MFIFSIAIILVIIVLAFVVNPGVFLCTTVAEREAVLLYRHGKFVRILETGRHRIFGTGYTLNRFDTRRRNVEIPGQEFLTADRAGVKVSAIAEYHIGDPLLYVSSSMNPAGTVYVAVQIALRKVIGSQTLEAVLDRKVDLSAILVAEVQPVADSLGIVLDRIAVKDLMIGGDLKKVFTESLAARQQSIVTLEKARAEAAGIRTLANAARVFETHPALLQLKFLQALEKADGGIAQPLALGAAGKWLDFLRQ